jgi:hypothetical protein
MMDNEVNVAPEFILHLSVLLGPVVRPPELLESMIKLGPSVFHKFMLVFIELVLLPLVDGGQNHLLLKGKFS